MLCSASRPDRRGKHSRHRIRRRTCKRLRATVTLESERVEKSVILPRSIVVVPF
jgi:hypothetical protein